MDEALTPENCGARLMALRLAAGLSRHAAAKKIGLSEQTIARLETKEMRPTERFMNGLRELERRGLSDGFRLDYENLGNTAEKRLVVATGAAGVPAAVTLVAGLGYSGVSAAGLTSGLAALGGTMIVGVAAVAVIPLGFGAAGYLGLKGYKQLKQRRVRNSEKIDARFEMIW